MISLDSSSSSYINYDHNNTDKLTSKQIYQYGNQKIEYNLVRSKHRKISELILDEKNIYQFYKFSVYALKLFYILIIIISVCY
jgi:hypothetical protein